MLGSTMGHQMTLFIVYIWVIFTTSGVLCNRMTLDQLSFLNLKEWGTKIPKARLI